MNEEEGRLITVLISIIAAMISGYAAYRSRLSAQNTRQLQILTFRREYLKDLRQWAEKVLQLLGQAVYACDLDPNKQSNPSFYELRHKLERDLSVLWDQGRWFLPNEKVDQVGLEKPIAYRGFRPEALNAIGIAHKLVSEMSYTDHAMNKPKKSGLVDAKRDFTSQVQHVLDPRASNAEMELLSQVAKRQ